MLLTCSVDKNLAPTAEFLWDAVQLPPAPPSLVLSGHAAFLTSY